MKKKTHEDTLRQADRQKKGVVRLGDYYYKYSPFRPFLPPTETERMLMMMMSSGGGGGRIEDSSRTVRYL